MTLAADRDLDNHRFAIEDITTGLHASGFGQVGDGRSFSFRIEKQVLVVEIYRPRITGPIPQAEDVVAAASRRLTDVDVFDERSVSAAVRDAVADAHSVTRTAR
jgi:hypothetical protein